MKKKNKEETGPIHKINKCDNINRRNWQQHNKKKGFKINYENQYLHAIFLTKTVILYSILLYSMYRYVPGGWAGHPHHDLR